MSHFYVKIFNQSGKIFSFLSNVLKMFLFIIISVLMIDKIIEQLHEYNYNTVKIHSVTELHEKLNCNEKENELILVPINNGDIL